MDFCFDKPYDHKEKVLPNKVTLLPLWRMRLIKEKTLYDYCRQSRYKQAEESVKALIYDLRFSSWNNANELKSTFGNASIIGSKRVVFNIKGNEWGKL